MVHRHFYNLRAPWTSKIREEDMDTHGVGRRGHPLYCFFHVFFLALFVGRQLEIVKGVKHGIAAQPSRKPGWIPPHASDPDSALPQECFLICAVLRISLAGTGSRASHPPAPPSHHHHRNWPDSNRARQPRFCGHGAVFCRKGQFPASSCVLHARNRTAVLIAAGCFARQLHSPLSSP